MARSFGKVKVDGFTAAFADQYWNKRGAIGRSKGFLLSTIRGADNEAKRRFNTHLVTKELDAGPFASNGSDTITYESAGRKNEVEPNLYTFLGFTAGTDPLYELRELFNRPITPDFVSVKNNIKGKRLSHVFSFDLPSPELAYKITPMPNWAGGGKSWVKAIESGALLDDTINYYLAVSSSHSLSGRGLQVKVAFKRLARDFNHTPYVTVILEDLRSRIEGILRSSTATR